MIKITIATCTYNAAQELPATLESVKRQKYREVEHLIVDGASKDDSLDILLRYKSQNDAMENSMDVKITAMLRISCICSMSKSRKTLRSKR